jgi:hypothetical protein
LNAKWRMITAAGLAIIASGSFFVGRHAEEKRLEARDQGNRKPKPARLALSSAEPPSYRQLAIVEMLALPFGDFYEALRSAPVEAREKWSAELARMPEGPRRTSAAIAFYKLLVQFDPKGAIKAVSQLEDKSLQDLAVSCLVDAAPGFAMRDMAELVLNERTKSSGRRDYLSEVLRQWMPIDPAAVARFFDERPIDENVRPLYYGEVLTDWAAIDPKAAKEWMEKNQVRDVDDAFISGWYINDRAASVSYALAHAAEPDTIGQISSVLSALYLDSKEEAKKFIEALPDEKTRHDAVHRSFEWMTQFGTAEETGEPARTPRAVADWLTQFPPSYWNGTLRSAFERWADGSPEEVFAWIQQQPPDIKDAVAAEYTIKTFEEPAPKAILPVIQIADPKLRDQLLMAMLRNTQRSFDEWKDSIAKTGASPAQKDHVLEILAAVEVEKAYENNQGNEK